MRDVSRKFLCKMNDPKSGSCQRLQGPRSSFLSIPALAVARFCVSDALEASSPAGWWIVAGARVVIVVAVATHLQVLARRQLDN